MHTLSRIFQRNSNLLLNNIQIFYAIFSICLSGLNHRFIPLPRCLSIKIFILIIHVINRNFWNIWYKSIRSPTSIANSNNIKIYINYNLHIEIYHIIRSILNHWTDHRNEMNTIQSHTFSLRFPRNILRRLSPTVTHHHK